MAITNYPQYMNPAGKAGQLSNYQDYVADTYPTEAIVPFGAAVQLNATGTAVKPIAASGTVIGIALAQDLHDYVENKDDQKYPVNAPAAIVKRGRIFVVAGDDVINGQAVKVDPTTQKFVASGTGVIDVKNAVFKANASENQLVEIEINLP